MNEAEENLINRIQFVLLNNPNSTSAEIGALINVSRQKVSQAIKSDTSGLISTRILSGKGPARYILSGMKARIADEQAPQRNVLADAINALIYPLTNDIRQHLDNLLSTIVKEEVDTAIGQIQARVKTRLSESLIMPTKPDDKGWFGESIAAKDQARQHDQNAKMRTALDVILPIKSLPVGLPPGSFVPQDVVSKRTSHKPAGKAVPAEPVQTADQPQKPKKLTVVGIRPNMQDMIKREFGKSFDLRLFSPDQLSTIKKAVQPGDDVICLASNISHKHTECVEAAGGIVDAVHGGIPTLRAAMIERMAPSEKAAW